MRFLSFMLIAGALACIPGAAVGQDTVSELDHGQRIRAMGKGIGEEWREGIVARLASRDEVCWGLFVEGFEDGVRGRILLLHPSNTVEVWGEDVGSSSPWVRVRLDAVFEAGNCTA